MDELTMPKYFVKWTRIHTDNQRIVNCSALTVLGE